VNVLLAKINLIRKFEGLEKLDEEIKQQLNVFEAPGMLARNLSQQLV